MSRRDEDETRVDWPTDEELAEECRLYAEYQQEQERRAMQQVPSSRYDTLYCGRGLRRSA